jgi:hypothetical protein
MLLVSSGLLIDSLIFDRRSGRAHANDCCLQRTLDPAGTDSAIAEEQKFDYKLLTVLRRAKDCSCSELWL